LSRSSWWRRSPTWYAIAGAQKGVDVGLPVLGVPQLVEDGDAWSTRTRRPTVTRVFVESQPQNRVVGEARWPMAGAVVAAMVLTFLLPKDLRPGPNWLLPLLEGVLLLAVIVGDPGAITRRSALLRGLSIALVAVLVFDSLWTTALLIDALLHGGQETNSASALLSAGAIVWASNNIAFALLYWELDSGGAAARAHQLPRYADFAFPQQLNPALAPADWRPRFIDYLYLGFTNAVAFSPTDTMPLTRWPKVAMTVQSTISLAILGLVIARAVNVFT
jgi:uncharacterized membrane protein